MLSSCSTASQNLLLFFFFNDTATTEIYTLSLHDALPILVGAVAGGGGGRDAILCGQPRLQAFLRDRKSTRLNSSHSQISYAVFCLKKKKTVHHKNIDAHKTQTRYIGPSARSPQ